MNKATLLATACLVLAACGSETPPDGDGAVAADAEFTGNTGRVLSTIQVPGYTYIEVRNAERSLWLASNPVEVTEGEVISWTDSAMMRDFQSKTLNRTFDELMFVAAIYKGVTDTPHTIPAGSSGVVRSSADAAGYTYIELETDSGQVVWLATPQTGIVAGDRLSWQGGSKMTNFTSNSLNKTFPEILFVQSISASRP